MLPTPFTVSLQARTATTGTNKFNNVPHTFATATTHPVYGWAPAGTGEPFEVAREAVTWDLDLYAPPGFPAGPHDRITLPEGLGTFEVDGKVQDFTHGPFGFRPGVRVRLAKVEG